MQVSVIVPVYNLSRYIVRTLDSLKQSKQIEYEIIIINDGSNDNSASVIKEYISKSNQNIIYIEQKNFGVSASRNTGIKIAKGDYIIFLDGDDFVEPDYIYKLYSTAIQNKCEIVTCLYNHVKLNGSYVCKNYNRFKKLPNIFKNRNDFLEIFFLNTTILNTGSLIFESKLIKENNILFDERMTHCEDHKFFIQAFLLSNKIYLLKDILYNYFQRDDSLTHDIDPITIRDKVNLYTTLLKFNKSRKLFPEKIKKIIMYYSIPTAINNLFELYSYYNKTKHFKRYYNRKVIRNYLFKAIFFKHTPKKNRIIFFLLLFIPSLYKYYIKKTLHS